MLIQALCEYYNILSKNNMVLPEGFSEVNIHYLVCLTPDGKIEEIIDWQKTVPVKGKNGKITEKKVPRRVVMPKRTQKPGIDYNIIEHRPLYLFGLNDDKGVLTPNDRTEKAKKSHEIFVQSNFQFIEGMESPVINAYRNFIRNWNPEKETENPFLLALGKKYSSGGYAFCVSGETDKLLHQDEQIRQKWLCQFKENQKGQEKTIGQCSILGTNQEIARIHNKINGVAGGQATGTILVGYNNPSDTSYENEQSYNSSISVTAMNQYTECLNYLLTGTAHKMVLDDMTMVFWAMDKSGKYEDLFSCLSFGNFDKVDEEQVNMMLKKMMTNAEQGCVTTEQIDVLEDIDPNVDFYIAGFKPNVSRIALKFLYRRKFGSILENITAHQKDIQISERLLTVPLWRIKRELVSSKSEKENIDPGLMTKLLEAILYGTRYPTAYLATLIRRIRTDKTVNGIRAGMIKAYLNRNARFLKEREEITLSLNKTNTNPAYLCGRLFAVLEKLQQEASGDTLNRTIRDSYFASASASPAIIFPKLLRLAQNHLNKVAYPVFYNKLIGEIVDQLAGEFPDTLMLKEQGTFIVGYYQQYQNFFEKKENSK